MCHARTAVDVPAASAAFVCVLQCVSSMVCLALCYGIRFRLAVVLWNKRLRPNRPSKADRSSGENELACEIDSPWLRKGTPLAWPDRKENMNRFTIVPRTEIDADERLCHRLSRVPPSET